MGISFSKHVFTSSQAIDWSLHIYSNVCKSITAILNNRLLSWSNTSDIITDARFGFKPKCGTGDAIFALHSIISNCLSRGKRLYCAFIDLKKFDSVNRQKLWLKLSQVGIQGKLLKTFQSMDLWFKR